MDGCQKRICNVDRSYECSRLESQLLADAYRRVLPPKQFRLARRGPEEAIGNSLGSHDASRPVDRLQGNVNRTELSLTMEGVMV